MIVQVHEDYLRSGADIISTASYQASFQAFEKKNISIEDGHKLLKLR